MVIEKTITEITEKLLKNLREEIDYYHQIMDQTRQQRKALDETDIKALLECVREKEAIIGKIKKIDEELVPYREEWKKRKNEMSEYSRKQCEKYVAELNTILEKLMQLENENEKLLADRVKKLEKDLENIQKGKQAHKSYLKNNAADAQFIDKKK
jgi:uncharacterized protein YejL (UPF0352 family)